MSRTSRLVIVAAGLIGVIGISQPAWATFDNLKGYKQAYPGKEPKEYTCRVCHEGAMGKATDLNGYGKALKQLPAPANPRKLTIDDFKAAEAADPDGDGVATAKELEAGTDPSDAASVPPAAASSEAPAAPAASGAATPPADPAGSTQ